MLMEGFSMVFGDPLSIVLVAAGTLIGTIFGAIPGLTATMAVTICLPMTFAMSDNRAIALLMALYIGGISGGLVSSILLNIPGTPASMVTAFDGAPMARKARGAKAPGHRHLLLVPRYHLWSDRPDDHCALSGSCRDQVWCI